jgi:hypothetical protein
MFNLDKAIAAWRRRMAVCGVRDTDLLDELEAHLRDDIGAREDVGIPLEAAFESAVASIGRPQELQAEFSKLKHTAWPRFLRICCYAFPACMLGINFWTLLAYEISTLQRTVGIAWVSILSLYLFSLQTLIRSLRGRARLWMAKVLKMAVILLFWPVWALLEATHIVPWSLGIVGATVMWCLYAAAAMTLFSVFVLERSRRPGDSGGPLPPFQPKGQPIPPSRPTPREFGATLRRKPSDPQAKHALACVGDDSNPLPWTRSVMLAP